MEKQWVTPLSAIWLTALFEKSFNREGRNGFAKKAKNFPVDC